MSFPRRVPSLSGSLALRQGSLLRSLFVFLCFSLLLTPSVGFAQSKPLIRWMHGGHGSQAIQGAMTPDGAYSVTVGLDNTIKIRRMSDGVLLRTLALNQRISIDRMALSPDGTLIAATSVGSIDPVRIWRFSDGAIVQSLPQPDTVKALAWSPDGTRLAAALGNKTAIEWNVSSGALLATMTGHTNVVGSVAFSPDGTQIVTGSSDKTVRVWNAADGSLLTTLTGHTDSLYQVAFSSDNRTVASCSQDNTIRLWDAPTGSLLRTINTATVNRTIALSPDGTTLTGGSVTSTVTQWKVSDGSLLRSTTVGPKTTFVGSVTYSPDGSQIFAVGWQNEYALLNSADLTPVHPLPLESTGEPLAIAVTPNGQHIICSAGGDGIIWNTTTGAQETILTSSTVPAFGAVAISPDGASFATLDDTLGLRLWDFATGKVTKTQALQPKAAALVWSTNGKYIYHSTGLNEGHVIVVRKADDLSIVTTLSGHTNQVLALAVSPNGKYLASAGMDKTILLWDLTQDVITSTPFLGHTDTIESLSFSHDSTKLLSGGLDHSAILWSVANGAILQTFSHPDQIATVAIAPDDKTMATACVDNHLRLWRLSDGNLLSDYTEEVSFLFTLRPAMVLLAYTPDNTGLVYGRQDAVLVEAANPWWNPSITDLSINPNSVLGGQAASGTVTIGQAALPGGAILTLSSDNSVATVPPTITIPEGATSANFSINTTAVSSTITANITVGNLLSSRTAALAITPPGVSALSLSPTSVKGGQSSTGTVTISSVAPASGITIGLSSSDSATVSVPSSVTIAAGATSATFTATTKAVAANRTVTLTANLGGTATANLTVTAPTLTNMSLSPTSVKGGQNSTGTVTISDPAPTGGITIALSSNNASLASGPGTVTIAAGATSATFTVTTHGVATSTNVTLTATLNGATTSAALTLTPPDLTALSVAPTSVKGGTSSTGTLTLSDPAGSSGLVVTLSSDKSAASVPATVTVPAGSKTVTFTVNTIGVSSNTVATLTASFNGQSQTATLTVQSPLVATISLNPTVIHSLQTATATVTLDGPAPTGGMLVTLASANSSVASIPATVTVPTGSTSATATVTAGTVTTDTRVLLAAAIGNSNASVTLTVQPAVARLPFDFNNDGHNDIVFQNSDVSQIVLWYTNGLNIAGGTAVNALPVPGWFVVGCADINHDGNPDLFLQNQTSGQINVWYLNGYKLTGGESLSQLPATGYKVVGVGDFNADGKPDLLFQNSTTGQLAVWFLDGSKVTGGVSVPQIPAAGYNVVGVGDFNGDGKPDIVFQNQTTNQVVIWYMNGTSFSGNGGAISYTPPMGWQVKAIEDIDNDGKPDLVFQNQTTNQVVIWYMNNLNIVNSGNVSIIPAQGYKIRGPH